MDKMPMCRICLVENVRMYILNDQNLQELYVKLTDIPFVTEDRRPMLACFFCIAKLKQCYQLQRKCLEAEELFAQMMNEPNPSVNRGQLKISSGLIVTPVENISIVDVSHIESIAVKEELPDVYERLDDVIEPKVGQFKYEVELELLNNSYSDAEDIPPQQSKPGLERDVPLIEIKTEVEEEQEVSMKKRRASETTRAAVPKKINLHMKGKKLEDVITEIQKKNEESDTKVTQNTPSALELIPKFQEPLTNSTPPVNINVTLDTNCRNNVKQCNVTKHTGEKPFKCEECQRCFSKKFYYTRHIRAHTGEKPYKCEECQRSFSQTGDLARHTRTHTREKPFKCEECQRCFSKKFYLTRHIRAHTGEKPYKCEECQRCFSQTGDLARHTRTHTGEKLYKCEECQLCFSKKVHFTSHIRAHVGKTPYKCEECQRCFTQKVHLKRHILTHTGEKPYKCHECQLCFTLKTTLLSHIRTHTGEKPYKCEVCQLCFSQRTTLLRHIRTHTGEKPYKCEECQRCFRCKQQLTRHIGTHTSEKT